MCGSICMINILSTSLLFFFLHVFESMHAFRPHKLSDSKHTNMQSVDDFS